MTKREMLKIQKLAKTLDGRAVMPRGFGLWTPDLQIHWLRDHQVKAPKKDQAQK